MDSNGYGVGIDIGTGSVKVVVGVWPKDTESSSIILPNIIGVGVQPSLGMRKGVIVDIDKVYRTLDKALGDAERMSGLTIDHAMYSINGTKITGMSSRGVVAVNGPGQKISRDEVERAIKAAQIVKLAPNQVILSTQPRTYKVDNQDGIRDPVDMTGVRLEVDAYVTTAIEPQIRNIDEVAQLSKVDRDNSCVPSGVAASDIALTDQQRENGAAVLDIGHSTTTLVIYDEGDIVDIKVIPIGSNNITCDLAVGLQTDFAIAEQVKIRHAVAAPELRRGNETVLTVKAEQPDGRIHAFSFKPDLVDSIVAARLLELFEQVNKELKRVHYQAALPGGIVLTGGGAKLRGITDLARAALKINTHVFTPRNYQMVSKIAADPSFSAAIRLMERDLDAQIHDKQQQSSRHGGLKRLLKLFHFE